MTLCTFGPQMHAGRQNVDSTTSGIDLVEKFGKFRDDFMVPLTKVLTALRGVDGDLAEFAAHAFEQVLDLEDSMEAVVISTSYGDILRNPTHRDFLKMDFPNGWKADAEHRVAPHLEERFEIFREHVLYLLLCTDVVHDCHLISCAGTHEQHGVPASVYALHYLHQIETAFVKWECWFHEEK